MMGRRSGKGGMTLYLRYQADIWVDVDTDDEDVVNVVVDDATMSAPVQAG